MRDLFLGEELKQERYPTDLTALLNHGVAGEQTRGTGLLGISRSWSLLYKSRRQVLACLALRSREKSKQLLFLHGYEEK